MMPTSAAGPAWAAVLALKANGSAKTRLGGLPDPLRRRLAWTMALDTLRPLNQLAAAVCVVSDQPELAARLRGAGFPRIEVIPEDGRAGLNAALAHGAAHLQAGGHRTVVACVGDLPALRPESVQVVLRAATGPRSFLADASGVGTTMLVARDVDLDPRFEGRSADRHAGSGAARLTDALLGRPVPDARRDVDTEIDLAEAVEIGLGPASRTLLDPATGRLGRYAAVEVSEQKGSHLRVVTADGHSSALVLDQQHADGVRPGPAHAVQAGPRVLSIWR